MDDQSLKGTSSDYVAISMLKHEYSSQSLMGDAKRRCIQVQEYSPKDTDPQDYVHAVSLQEIKETTFKPDGGRCTKEELGDNPSNEDRSGQDVCFGMVLPTLSFPVV